MFWTERKRAGWKEEANYVNNQEHRIHFAIFSQGKAEKRIGFKREILKCVQVCACAYIFKSKSFIRFTESSVNRNNFNLIPLQMET